MRANELLRRQFLTVNAILHSMGDDLSDAEWQSRILPGTNVLAFELWHIARSQDWAVQTLARGVPEVITRSPWADNAALSTRGIGVGLTLDEADALARRLARTDVLAYADAVHTEILTWLSTLDDADLDSFPDVPAHYATFPEYTTPSMRAETPWAFERPPLWRCVVGPAVGHVRDHLAQIELLKQQFRSRQ